MGGVFNISVKVVLLTLEFCFARFGFSRISGLIMTREIKLSYLGNTIC